MSVSRKALRQIIAAALIGIACYFIYNRFLLGNHPITFYGRIVDNNGKPIPAAVECEIHVRGFALPILWSRPGGYIKQRLVHTDPDGGFVIKGFGHSVWIGRIDAMGYTEIGTPTRNFGFSYPYSPLPDDLHPAVFSMQAK